MNSEQVINPKQSETSNPLGLYEFVFGVLFIALRLIQMPSIYLFDDAFITFRYARNLVEGEGYIYNVGEAFLGVTGPLWGLIVGCLSLFGEIGIVTIFFNIIISFATLLIMKQYFGYDRLKFTFMWTIVLCTPYIIRINLGGMEADLFVFLSLISLYLFEKKQNLISIPLGCLVYFIRPEAALLVIILSLVALNRYKMKSIGYILAGLIIVGLGHFWIYSYYGSPLPQSIIGKSSLSLPFADTMVNLLARDATTQILLLLGILGVYIRYKNKSLKLFHLFLLVYISAYLVKSQQIFTWYIYPVLILYADLSSVTLSNAIKKMKIGKTIYQPVLIVIPIMLSVYLFTKKSPDPVTVNIYDRLYEFWEKENGDGKTIFADDIGIIGYSSNAYIYDSESLISPIASKYDNKLTTIIEKMPDYIFMNITPEVDSFFRQNGIYENYTPMNRFNKSGDNNPTIEQDKLTPDWKMDYFLLKRNDIE